MQGVAGGGVGGGEGAGGVEGEGGGEGVGASAAFCVLTGDMCVWGGFLVGVVLVDYCTNVMYDNSSTQPPPRAYNTHPTYYTPSTQTHTHHPHSPPQFPHIPLNSTVINDISSLSSNAHRSCVRSCLYAVLVDVWRGMRVLAAA